MPITTERPTASSREALPFANPACAHCPQARRAFEPGVQRADYLVAVAGNPNTGKSTVFNAITGLRQHVGNWPGKTVSRSEGTFRHHGLTGRIVDLPGTYSLSAFSPEEVITRDFLLGGTADAIVDVVDATNLERNLYLTAQLLELGVPLVIALNMSDGAHAQGLRIDTSRLGALLGDVPVIETVGHRGRGMEELIRAVAGLIGREPPRLRLVA